MRILRSSSLSTLRADSSELVGVTIGNFDGFHLGHKVLYNELFKGLELLSAKRGKLAQKVLMTFYPHPRQVLGGIKRKNLDRHPALWPITTYKQRFQLAREMGFHFFCALRFRQELASLSPEEFVDKFLVVPFAPSLVVVGHDWRFGKDREGNAQWLQENAERFGFETVIVSPQMSDGVRVSTGRVRGAINLGGIDTANRYLGREYSLIGRVVHGDARGRDLGFPTANLEFTRRVLPGDGVYACWATVEGKRCPAVTNIGIRPTVDGTRRVVETHLLDVKDWDL